jgi:hypothetical protein
MLMLIYGFGKKFNATRPCRIRPRDDDEHNLNFWVVRITIGIENKEDIGNADFKVLK